MALVSAQKVEFITSKLIDVLAFYKINVYGITTQDFLDETEKSKRKRRKMLGDIFKLLKLNPEYFPEDKLNLYLKKRNTLVHELYTEYLSGFSEAEIKDIIDFCNEFGKMSNDLESFFKGCVYFCALRHVKDKDDPEFAEFRKWDDHFVHFIKSAIVKNLKNTGKEK